MNKFKRIIISLAIIGGVGAAAIAATGAYFFDTEKQSDNTIEAGVVDIVVNGTNPWESHSGPFTLTDMKPSYTKYMEFTVRNLEESNEINLWKHINITGQTDGTITEPECTEGNGTWVGGGAVCTAAQNCCIDNYTPRNNLAAYTLYDLWVCEDPIEGQRCVTDPVTHKPSFGINWKPIIKEDQYVRLDNISSTWIHLGQLIPAKELKVVQSYHLSSWPDAPEPKVTNWAQGDVLTFDIELMATQLNAPGPLGEQATLNMVGKNPITWDSIPGALGTLTYNTAGATFDYQFTGSGLNDIDYCLIYYADPWPGDHPGALISSGTASSGNLTMSSTYNFGYDLAHSNDANYPAGAKIWLVPCSDYDQTNHLMTGWSPSTYLFEENLIQYDDTDI